jgi:signal transduction histidine kinase
MSDKLNILLLEDSIDDAWKIARDLRGSAVVVTAKNRAQFKALLRESDWDCVLMDWHTPDIQGEEAIKLVMENRPDAPVIIVTGSISYREAVDALKLGAVDCHDKNHLERLEHSVLEAVEKRDLKDKGRRANRLEILGELNASLAHDWNNILQAFLTGPDYLLRSLDAVLSDADRKVLGVLKSMGMRGAEMSQQITKFVRGTNGHNMKSVAPEFLLTEVRAFMQEIFPKNIRIETYTVPATSNIRCDPTLIHQVLLNLCVNARDAMPKGGDLAVHAQNVHLNNDWLVGDFVCIEVKDTGEGIPDSVVPEIFKPFFTTKPPGKGTGMGLSIARGIAIDHGGDIIVVTGPSGTTFSVYLPVEKVEAPEPHKIGTERPSGNKEVILIVDDESSMRFFLEITLQNANYKTLSAANGLEALSVFRTNPGISLLLSDVSMPSMNGLELVEALRAQRFDLPVVYMTGHTDMENPIGALTIRKPFESAELLRAVSKALVDNRQPTGQTSAA